MLVPLYGFLKGDTIGLIILAQDTDTIREVGAKLQEAACIRVAPAAAVEVRHGDQVLDPDRTVAELGLGALERVDVIPKES
ncbi:MAG TPA: toluene-4-monooxygenase system B family protein [Planctomycetota bacterium]|nr:toluene-4-monooxygenase system B family protein [Planctomycetota bacterium]